MNKDLPDVTEVYRMLLQEQIHKSIPKSSTVVEFIAFASEK